MYCPQCRSEYVDGITQCFDCQVPLVWSLHEENEQDSEPVEWAPLVSVVNQTDIAVITSLLESEKIPYYIQGEHVGFLPHGAGFASVIHVEKNRLLDAQEYIKDLQFNEFKFSDRNGDDLK